MAVQLIPLIVSIVGGAATVGAGVYVYKAYQAEPETIAPVALVEPSATPEIAKKPEIKISQPKLPEFHVLTVEQDGSTLIAGSAPANSKVEIIHGEKVIASSKAAPNGDFAIVLDKPLGSGAYELHIRASTTDGKTVTSAEAGIISIPEKGDELIAMVSKPGEASKLIQVPKPVVKPEIKPQPKPVVKVDKAKPPPPAKSVVVAKIPEPRPVKPAKPAPKIVVPEPVNPVLLGAVEVEGNEVFVAGTGEPGRIVNVYIDDKFIGEATVNAQGSFLLEAQSTLEFGDHNVRADMLGTNKSDVSARAQVALIHNAPPELVKPEPITPEKPTLKKPAPIVIAKLPDSKQPTPKKVEPIVAETKPSRSLTAEKSAEIKLPTQVVETKLPAQAAEVKPQPVKKVIRTGSSVIIRSGDNLWRVSRRILGRGIRYSTIYNANKSQIRDPSLIFPGQIFKIPSKTAIGQSSNNG